AIVAQGSGYYSSPGVAAYKAPTSGTYYVEVIGYGGSYTGSYALAVEDLLDDHGDSYATATSISGTGVSTSGQFEIATDQDWFSISLSTAKTYTVTSGGGSALY